MDCELCELSKVNKPVSGCRFSNVDPTAPIDVVIVGDFPHEDDVKYQKPFSGKLGTALARALATAGFSLPNIYVTTLVKCRPEAPNHIDGRIKKSHTEACSIYLMEELAEIQPKLVVLLGDSVFKYFYPDKTFTDFRGKILTHEGTGLKTLTTYHILATLASSKFDELINKDLKTAYNSVYSVSSEIKQTKDYKFATLDRKNPLEFLQKIVERTKTADVLSFDIETHGTGYFNYKLLSIGLSWKENTGVSIPIWVRDIEKVNSLQAVHDYKPEDHYKIEKIMQKNGKIKEKKTKILGLISDDFIAMSNLLPDEYWYVLNHENLSQIRAEIANILDKNPPLKKYWGENHDKVLGFIKEIMENDTPKVAHNGSYDVNRLRGIGITVKNWAYDTIVMHHLLDEERPHGLDDLSYVYTKDGGYKSEKNVYLASSQTSWANIPMNVLLPYNAQDADVTLQLFHIFKEELQKIPKLWKLFNTLSMPAQRMLTDMSFRGSNIDFDWINKTKTEYISKMKDLKVEFQQIIEKTIPNVYVVDSPEEEKEVTNAIKKQAKETGCEPKFPTFFNMNSNKQLLDLFLNWYHAPLTKKTKSGVALDSFVLKKIQKKYPAARVLLEYKALKKLESTYLTGLVEEVDADGKIHTEYKTYGTVTGRLASSTPNLQNVPGSMKPMFIPPKGYVCVNVDQSAAELHVLAWMSNDKKMIDIFENHRDLHRETAAGVFSKKPEDISDEERKIAKRVSFGTAYSISGQGLADLLEPEGVKISGAQGERFIKKWRETYKYCASFLDRSANNFLRYGFLETPFGRRRRKYKKFLNDSKEAASARQACNFPIQATASDIQLTEMVHMYHTLVSNGILPVFTVHDSIVMYCPYNKLEWLRDYYKQETCRRFPEINNCLMYTEMEVGRNYGEHIKLPYDCDFSKWKEENNALFSPTDSVK